MLIYVICKRNKTEWRESKWNWNKCRQMYSGVFDEINWYELMEFQDCSRLEKLTLFLWETREQQRLRLTGSICNRLSNRGFSISVLFPEEDNYICNSAKYACMSVLCTPGGTEGHQLTPDWPQAEQCLL